MSKPNHGDLHRQFLATVASNATQPAVGVASTDPRGTIQAIQSGVVAKAAVNELNRALSFANAIGQNFAAVLPTLRMLSKCISSHASYFADPQLLSSDLEDDQLSALATLAASCQLMILAIQKYPVTKPVSGPLMDSILKFEKCRASSMQAGSRSLLTFQKFLNGLERQKVFVRMTDGLRS